MDLYSPVYMSKTKKTVCAGGVVLNNKDEVLVVKSRDSSWSLPKGHIERGESPLEAALREIKEESGVTSLYLECYAGSYSRYKSKPHGGNDKSERKNIHVYVFRTSQYFLHPLDYNTREARWVSKEKVPKLLTHKKDKKYFQKLMYQL